MHRLSAENRPPIPAWIRYSTDFAHPLIEIYAELLKHKQEKQIESALRLIVPELIELQAAPMNGTSMFYADVGLRERIPLALIGEGTMRLLNLILGLYQAQGGVLLVNEIENGFHYSVLPQLWRLLCEGTKEFDVQVFATTHSRECVASAVKQFENEPEALRLIRLEKQEGTVKAYEYDTDTLNSVLEINLEVR